MSSIVWRGMLNVIGVQSTLHCAAIYFAAPGRRCFCRADLAGWPLALKAACVDYKSMEPVVHHPHTRWYVRIVAEGNQEKQLAAAMLVERLGFVAACGIVGTLYMWGALLPDGPAILAALRPPGLWPALRMYTNLRTPLFPSVGVSRRLVHLSNEQAGRLGLADFLIPSQDAEPAEQSAQFWTKLPRALTCMLASWLSWTSAGASLPPITNKMHVYWHGILRMPDVSGQLVDVPCFAILCGRMDPDAAVQSRWPQVLICDHETVAWDTTELFGTYARHSCAWYVRFIPEKSATARRITQTQFDEQERRDKFSEYESLRRGASSSYESSVFSDDSRFYDTRDENLENDAENEDQEVVPSTGTRAEVQTSEMRTGGESKNGFIDTPSGSPNIVINMTDEATTAFARLCDLLFVTGNELKIHTCDGPLYIWCDPRRRLRGPQLFATTCLQTDDLDLFRRTHMIRE